MKDDDIESLLGFYTENLYEARRMIEECEIDLGAVFGPLYPHLGRD